MRARPNMKMLACLGTYASRCRHTKWHSTNTVRLFNSLELEAQQAYSNRPAAKKKEEDRTRKNNRIKKRINTGKKVEDETGCHIYFLVFPTLLQAFSRFPRWNTMYLRAERRIRLDEDDYLSPEQYSGMSYPISATERWSILENETMSVHVIRPF